MSYIRRLEEVGECATVSLTGVSDAERGGVGDGGTRGLGQWGRGRDTTNLFGVGWLEPSAIDEPDDRAVVKERTETLLALMRAPRPTAGER